MIVSTSSFFSLSCHFTHFLLYLIHSLMSLRLSRLDLQAVPPRSVYLRNALMVMYSGCQNGGRQPGPRLVRVVARKTLVSGESLFLFLAVFHSDIIFSLYFCYHDLGFCNCYLYTPPPHLAHFLGIRALSSISPCYISVLCYLIRL